MFSGFGTHTKTNKNIRKSNGAFPFAIDVKSEVSEFEMVNPAMCQFGVDNYCFEKNTRKTEIKLVDVWRF